MRSRFWLWFMIVTLLMHSCADGVNIRDLQKRVSELENPK